MKNHSLIAVSLCTLTSALISFNSSAAGYQIKEQSSSAAANANAGRGAQITDASLLYSNPAALTQLEGRQLSVGVSGLFGNLDYNNAAATSTAGAPVSGEAEGDISLSEVIPHLFYSQPINDKWSAGLGLFVPYGVSSEYDDSFVGRYFAQKTGFTIVTLQPTLAYQASESLSLGVGVTLNHAEGVLSKYKDHSGMCELEDYLNQSYGMVVYQEAYCQSIYKVEGDDQGIGFNLGLHWQPTESTRLSLTYLSEVNYRLQGDSTITNTPITGANIGDDPTLMSVGDYLPAIDLTTMKLAVDPQKQEASALELVTPQSLSFGLDQQLNPQWSLQFSATWTEWSAFEHIVIESTEADGEISRSTEQPQNLAVEGYIGYIPEYWQDSWAFALGTSYQLTPTWLLKAGVSLDQDPTTNQHRTARVPTNDRRLYAVGANWQFSPQWSLDLAYNYVTMREASVEEYEYNGLNERLYASSGAYAAYTADYELSAHLFSLQVNYTF